LEEFGERLYKEENIINKNAPLLPLADTKIFSTPLLPLGIKKYFLTPLLPLADRRGKSSD